MKTKLFLVAFVLFGLVAQAQTAEEIINKYIENIGGVENWKNLNGFKFIGSVNTQGMELPIQMINVKSGKMIMKFNLQGKELTQQAFDGTTAWGTNFMNMKDEKSDSEITENIKRSMKDFPDPFVDYKSKGYAVEFLGNETYEGTECFKIKLTKTPNLVEGKDVPNIVYYFFDVENYVPVATETEVATGPMKGMVQINVFSDYQEVGGLYFPFSMTFKAKGQPGGQTMTIKEVVLNPEVSDDIFMFKGE